MKWIRVKLTEICRPKQWKNLPIAALKNDGYPVYGANGIIGRYDKYNHEFPTIAITCRGATCGTLNITEPKSYITSNAMSLDDIDKGVSQKFLYYALKNRGLKDVITGAAQPQITRESLKKISLLIPETLSDQIKIAQTLTQAEKLITQRKESIALLDEYLKSTFLEMFGDPVRNEKGWEILRLGKVALNENSKRVPVKQSDRDAREGIYPYYGATGIIDKIDNYKFDGEFLLIAEDGKNLLIKKKNNAFVAKGKFWVNNHAHVLSYSGVCNLRYLEFIINNTDITPYISGIDQVKLNKENLEKIPIPVPPLPLQTQFAQIVEKTEALKSQYEHSLRELEQLFGSLSQRAFKGELDLSRMEVSEDRYKISDTPPSPPPLKPEKVKKERPPVVVKEDTATSIWLSNRKKGKTGKVPFTPVEGNAVLIEFFNQSKGFHFKAFETFLKNEGFEYAFEQVKDFLFEKLEQKELLQYYSNVEWMEERYRQEIGSDEDDFSSDGRMWLVVNNKVVS